MPRRFGFKNFLLLSARYKVWLARIFADQFHRVSSCDDLSLGSATPEEYCHIFRATCLELFLSQVDFIPIRRELILQRRAKSPTAFEVITRHGTLRLIILSGESFPRVILILKQMCRATLAHIHPSRDRMQPARLRHASFFALCKSVEMCMGNIQSCYECPSCIRCTASY